MKGMGWPLVVVFCVIFVVVGVLVGLQRAPAETLGTMIAAFLAWLAPSPISSPGLAPREPEIAVIWSREDESPPTRRDGSKP